MYIAHYKSVNSSKEFYTQQRESLDFPAQVQLSNERYTLYTTYIVSGHTAHQKIKDRAKELNIPFDIEIQ